MEHNVFHPVPARAVTLRSGRDHAGQHRLE